MQVSQYILFFVGALGAFNGLLLSFYFLFFAKKRSLASSFLGCLMAALSLRIGKSVFVYFIPTLPKLYLQIGLSACLFIGPALFFFTRAAIERPLRLPAAWKRQLMGLALGM
ncbi:MAG: AraC family transcriptional regulator, partial [Hymenobacter sp.]